MNLDDLTTEDWRALAGVPVGGVYVYGNEDMFERLRAADIVSLDGSCVHREITRYGQGVIAAARVLVHGTSTVAAAWAEADRANAEAADLRAQVEVGVGVRNRDMPIFEAMTTGACQCCGTTEHPRVDKRTPGNVRPLWLCEDGKSCLSREAEIMAQAGGDRGPLRPLPPRLRGESR